MPVEIRELVIRATVEPGSEKNESADKARSAAEANGTIVSECVEQVLEILRKERER